MSWSPTIYVQFPDEAAARGLAELLGVEFPPDGAMPTGNHNFVLQAPIKAPWQALPVFVPDENGGHLVTPGIPEPGYWAMLRLATEWPGYEATMAALETAGVIREPANPSAAFFDG